MQDQNNAPVKVTGEERRHPAMRLLARACIELARQQLAEKTSGQRTTKRKRKAPPSGADTRG